jgi:hypothetical protein
MATKKPITGKKLTKQPVAKPRVEKVKVSEKEMNDLILASQKRMSKTIQREGIKELAKKSLAVGTAAITAARQLAAINKRRGK